MPTVLLADPVYKEHHTGPGHPERPERYDSVLHALDAFQHAQAGRIEAEIRYDSRQLRLHVRDDGKGIDSEVLKAGGRAGHYGIPGMRERANRFGGKLDFWSEAGAGTEAVLTVPGGVAYGGPNGGRFAFLRRKLWIHER